MLDIYSTLLTVCLGAQVERHMLGSLRGKYQQLLIRSVFFPTIGLKIDWMYLSVVRSQTVLGSKGARNWTKKNFITLLFGR
jgi:hypothetical protein